MEIKVIRNNKEYNIRYLSHMIHHTNLENVFKHGLLSHEEAHKKNLITKDISMSGVQNRRSHRKLKDTNGKKYKLHEFVPLYFNPRNPMLYKRKAIQHEIVILVITPKLLQNEDDNILVGLSDGNATSTKTKFYKGAHKLKEIPFETLFQESWYSEDEEILKENRRKMCAEILVYPQITLNQITQIVCPNDTMFQHVTKLKNNFSSIANHIDVKINPHWFF